MTTETVLSLDHPAAANLATTSDDPTFDAVWTEMRGTDVDVAYEAMDAIKSYGISLTPAVCQVILPLLRSGEDTGTIVNAVLDHIHTNPQETSTMNDTRYDNGLPDTDAPLADQIAESGIEVVAATVLDANGSSVKADESRWDMVDALLDTFRPAMTVGGVEVNPSTWADNVHNEVVARHSAKYFGQPNNGHITTIPVGPETQVDWDEDSTVLLAANGEQVTGILTRPTGEYRESNDGRRFAIRHVVRIRTFADVDEATEFTADLRRALKDAQIDSVSDGLPGFGAAPDLANTGPF